MSDERLIDYFIEQTDERFRIVHSRFDALEEKIDTLLQFKWQIIGGSLVISAILSVTIALLANYWP